MTRRLATLCAAVLLALGAAACGSTTSGASNGTPTPQTTLHARVALAECLRAHGIDVSDPTGTAGVGRAMFEQASKYPRVALQAALTACHSQLLQAFPRLSLSPQQATQLQHRLLLFAECLRAHGVQVPDPGAGIFGARQMFQGINRASPAFKSAATACSSLRPRRRGIARPG